MTTHVFPNCLVPVSTLSSTGTRPQLSGGVLAPNAALMLMNLWFFVSEVDGEVSISRVEKDGRCVGGLLPGRVTRRCEPAVHVAPFCPRGASRRGR
jgi:hypothetical protein